MLLGFQVSCYQKDIELTRASTTIGYTAISGLIILCAIDALISFFLEMMETRGLSIDLHPLEMYPHLQ